MSDKNDNVTPEYEGEVTPDEFAMSWENFFELYCEHGHYRGIECLSCNHSPVVPYYSNRDFGDESSYAD